MTFNIKKYKCNKIKQVLSLSILHMRRHTHKLLTRVHIYAHNDLSFRLPRQQAPTPSSPSFVFDVSSFLSHFLIFLKQLNLKFKNDITEEYSDSNFLVSS